MVCTFFNKRHPKETGSAEIKEFISYLALKKNLPGSNQNQVPHRSLKPGQRTDAPTGKPESTLRGLARSTVRVSPTAQVLFYYVKQILLKLVLFTKSEKKGVSKKEKTPVFIESSFFAIIISLHSPLVLSFNKETFKETA